MGEDYIDEKELTDEVIEYNEYLEATRPETLEEFEFYSCFGERGLA